MNPEWPVYSGSDHWTELITLLQMLVLVTFRDLTFATTKLRPAANLAIS